MSQKSETFTFYTIKFHSGLIILIKIIAMCVTKENFSLQVP